MAIIHGGIIIKEPFVSVIASLMHNSLKAKVTIVYCYTNGFSKISVRSSINNIDISKIVRDIAKKCDGSGGGHKKAAGAYIPKDCTRYFLENFKKSIKDISS